MHNGIKTDRETVRPCLKTIDPEGVERRKSHKLKRRVYVSQEPNFMWHVHGYDKVVSPFTEQLTVSAGKFCGLIYVLLTTILTLFVTSM